MGDWRFHSVSCLADSGVCALRRATTITENDGGARFPLWVACRSRALRSFHSLIFKEDRLFVAYYCYKSQYISFPLHQKQYNGLLVVQHVHTFMGFIIVWCISSLRINPHGESTFPTFVYLFNSNSCMKICNACDRQTFSSAVDFEASVVHHESHHLRKAKPLGFL